ncbi:MDR family MFS transporter [Pseudarthrobacter oxydans]|uniref:MDR family MFS transporter n=1 Tax=Pseudarthrobacter TaxID=1742993 RepID=UPI000CECA8F5|nr:MDR family MFS transporter [Pseudarthrobacter sp. NCCP-2145]MBD1539592.1 MFS transporter [Arthrobacter sp. S13_S34]GKV73739.1 MFS transporter [Pseudarthrobacter sp. NCCP-2145]
MTNIPARQAATAEGKQHIILLFVGLMLSMLLAALNQTVLSTALPTIVGELNGVSDMLWVITAFILASTITMPVYGKLGDLMGRKALLMAAIVLFMAGSVVGALAENMGVLITARVIQGLGGGGLMILSQAIIADVVPARERGKYMGVMGGVFAISSVAGPLLGGWFTEGPGWRWVFWINIPLGLLALAGAAFFLKLPRRSGKPRLDLGGMVLIAVATTCLVLFATWGGSKYEWNDPIILALIAGTIVAAVAFVLVERRTAEPIIPLHLFKDRNFNLTTIAGLLIGVAMFGAIGYLPTYLQMAFSVNATDSGLLMIPMMGALLVASVVSGQLVSKTGRYKWMPIAGGVIVAAALALLSTLKPEQPLWEICAYLAVMGLGLGLNMQILVLIVQNSFPLREVGTATASNNFFRQIGATLGSAVVGSLFASRLHDLLIERLPAAAAGGGAPGGSNSLTPAVVNALPAPIKEAIISSYNDALTPIFVWMVPLALIATVLLCFVKEKPLATAVEHDVLSESISEGNILITADDAEDDAPAQAASSGR